MSTTPADLEALWSRLAAAGPSSRRFLSMRINEAGAVDVHAAIRAADHSRCLLFDIDDVSAVGDFEFEVGGMRCSRAATETGQCLVLSLEDPARRDLFSTLGADIIEHAATDGRSHALAAVIARLDAWRQFLRSVGDGLSRNEVVGLIGELTVLLDVLREDGSLLSTWRAPDDGIQDFENVGHALEVKTTIGPGSRVTISRLDQLDDAGLDRLDLIHVQLFETPEGQCVDDLVDSISSLLNIESQRQFSNALLRRGLSPDDRRARAGIRASRHQITVRAVEAGFPRILRTDVPPAIVEVSYALELSQLAPHAAEPWSNVRDSFVGRAS